MKDWFKEVTGKFGYFPLFNLIWMISPIYYMFFESGTKMYIGFFMIAVFIVSYLLAFYLLVFYVKGIPYLALVALQVFLLAMFGDYYNIGYMYIGFYTVHFISRIENRNVFIGFLFSFVLAVLSVFIRNTPSWNDSVNFIGMFIIMLVFSIGSRFTFQKRRLEGKLDEANERIKDLVKREERSRIARDLHDTLGHTLSLITLKGQLIQKLVEKDPVRAKMEAKEIEQTSRIALKQVRELVANMRSVLIEEEIKEVEEILKIAGISFTLNKEGTIPSLPPVRQNMVSLCIREAVTNIIKHSKATSCIISTYLDQGMLRIKIADNGVGGISNYTMGSGISGIRERLSFIDGSLQVDSNENGTSLLLIIPLVVFDRKEGLI